MYNEMEESEMMKIEYDKLDIPSMQEEMLNDICRIYDSIHFEDPYIFRYCTREKFIKWMINNSVYKQYFH
jgi:hypothetical protein